MSRVSNNRKRLKTTADQSPQFSVCTRREVFNALNAVSHAWLVNCAETRYDTDKLVSCYKPVMTSWTVSHCKGDRRSSTNAAGLGRRQRGKTSWPRASVYATVSSARGIRSYYERGSRSL